MMWLFIATGFTGAMTLMFAGRWLGRLLGFLPTIYVYHSPKGGCTDAIVAELNKARREILVQAFAFTSKAVADALLEAKSRGVQVEILLDRSNEQEAFQAIGHLVEHGIVPQIDAQHAQAHNKVMLIDGRTLITGSLDFTQQAEVDNAENVLILKGHSEVNAAFQRNFVEHRSHCQAPKAKVPAAKAA